MSLKSLVLAGMMFDGSGAPPVRDAAVAIEGDRITWVGSAREVAGEPGSDTLVIDARDKTVLPGLMDIHAHLCLTGERPTRYDVLTATETEVAANAIGQAQAALRAGITTIRDCGGKGMITLNLRDAIAGGMVVGPRLVVAGQAITTTGGHFWPYSIEADDVTELRKAARRLLRDGVDFIKLFGTGGSSTMSSRNLVPQYSVEEFRLVIEEARLSGKHVTSHLQAVEGIRNAVDAGIPCLEHCQFFGPDGDYAFDEELAARIADRGIPISLGLGTRWRGDKLDRYGEFLNPRQIRQSQTMVEGRIDVLRRLRAAGVKIVASTDIGTLGALPGDLPELMNYLVNRGVGMSVPEVIHSATGRAAEAIWISKEVGTLEKGKIADLIVVDGDPMADVLTLQKVRRVLRNGVTVVTDGKLAA